MIQNTAPYGSVIQTFLGYGTLISLKKSRGTPPAESVKKRNSVAYIDSIKLFSSSVGKFSTKDMQPPPPSLPTLEVVQFFMIDAHSAESNGKSIFLFLFFEL